MVDKIIRYNGYIIKIIPNDPRYKGTDKVYVKGSGIEFNRLEQAKKAIDMMLDLIK